MNELNIEYPLAQAKSDVELHMWRAFSSWFRCHAINTGPKKYIGNRPVEEAKKMNVIKD